MTRGAGGRRARDRVQSPHYQPRQLRVSDSTSLSSVSPSAKQGHQGPTPGSRED